MKTLIVILTSLLILTGCDAATQAQLSAVAAGTQAAPIIAPADPAVTLHDKLLGTWTRVGRYDHGVYQTSLPTQTLTFTDTQMTLSFAFHCDNTILPAQVYEISYTSGAMVTGSLSRTNAGTCPTTYTTVTNAGTDSFPIQMIDPDGNGMQVTTLTYSNGQTQADVYHKE